MIPCKMAIDKLTVQVKGIHYFTGEKLLKSPVFTAENIKNILARVMPQNEELHWPDIAQCTLNLGRLPASEFEGQFPLRLEKALTEYLSGLQQETTSLPEAQQHAASTSEPLTLLARVHQDADVLYPLAVCCLQPQQRQVILHSRQKGQVQLLLQRLLQGNIADHMPAAGAAFTRITESRLTLAALFWLLQDRSGVRWLSEHHPETPLLQMWWAAIDSSEISAKQITALLSYRPPSTRWHTVARRWLLPLWQRKTVRERVQKHAGKTVTKAIDDGFVALTEPAVRHLTPVSHAGLVLLWPLLPQLFSLLELTQDNAFPDDDARWQAVLCLDVLAGGTGQPAAERLVLNRLLCGIALEVPLPDLPLLTPPQQQLTDDWLTAISHQLPAWHRFSLTDIRQLFLQRPGAIDTESQPPQISVQPESFDLLLGNWPWPLTLVQLPWLAQPLTLNWPLHHHTG